MSCQTSLRSFMVVGLALVLLVMALPLVGVTILPAQAASRPSLDSAPVPFVLPPARPLLSHLTLLQSASTSAGGDGSIVNNGQRMIYNFTVTVDGSGPANSVIITDPLPPGIFESIQGCNPPECAVGLITTTFTTRGGSQINITRPATVTWSIASIGEGQVRVLGFSARVICQPDGASFSNSAQAAYIHSGGAPGFYFSNAINTGVRIALPSQDGQFSLSTAPEWCSGDDPPGGVTDMDWGDFDQDGYLDLALASYDDSFSDPARFGITVYRNDRGTLKLFWHDGSHHVEGVKWADFNNDGILELVTTGEYGGCCTDLNSPGDSGYGFTGINYIYQYNGSNGFNQVSSFNTNDGIFRTAPADFDGNGTMDLAVASYWGGCTVALYKNRGTDAPPGRFHRSDPGNTTESYCLFSGPFANYSGNDSGIAHALAWGDANNDGFPDLAVGHRDGTTAFNTIRVYLNNNAGVLTETNKVVVDTTNLNSDFGYTFSLAWGDYDGDGLLDLAAGFSSLPRYNFNPAAATGGFRVYHNNGGSFSLVTSVATPHKVGAVEWGDFDGSGHLELAVAEADTPVKIYEPSGGTFSLLKTLQTSSKGDVYGLRGVDFNNEGNLELAVANYTGESFLITTIAPFLKKTLGPTIGGPFAANSVAWGDTNGDHYPDLLFGTNVGVKLNYNTGSIFSPAAPFSPNPPARAVAFANVNGDSNLDLALGLNGQNLIYLNNGGGSFPSIPNWIASLSFDTYSLAFGDFNQDTPGRLDLVVGNSNSPNQLYMNQGTLPATTPAWQAPLSEDTRAVAWGYYNNDILPDLAVANNGQPTRIYANTGLNSFSLAQSLAASNARSVAWGDYDGDGDMDLAVGNFGQPNQIYQNNGGNLSLVWTAPVVRNTTSVAWGDWNNDGHLDLAVGNYGQPNQVYSNLDSTPGSPRLVWVWQSADAPNTTGIAWGDYDRDGDLDLAISRDDGIGSNGLYENTYVSAAHLPGSFTPHMPLPQNPTYLSVLQPGNPNQVFTRTAPLTNPANLAIPVSFTVYDPDASRNPGSLSTTNSDRFKVLSYQYSLDGGGQWYTATVTGDPGTIAAQRGGVTRTVNWQAGQNLQANNPNLAVSDDTRFRITIARQNGTGPSDRIGGPIQRVMASAISPPFRVRNTSCLWPENVTVSYPLPVNFAVPVQLIGGIGQWSGTVITFTWDFGNNVISQGVLMQHTFLAGGPQVITLTVDQPPCPVGRRAFLSTVINVGGAKLTYLPLLLKSSVAPASLSSTPETNVGPPRATPVPESSIVKLDIGPGSPGQVTGLSGSIQPEGTTLQWQPNSPDDAVLGYRVYRSKVGAASFQVLAELPPDVTRYTDPAAPCGTIYFVTAYNAQGGSLPSTASFVNSPCQ